MSSCARSSARVSGDVDRVAASVRVAVDETPSSLGRFLLISPSKSSNEEDALRFKIFTLGVVGTVDSDGWGVGGMKDRMS